ncbi:MAG: SAM-dependent methyltransferase [Verrucomicrobiaceae bacterium]|nr:SAM-dependent methyltransferase [Verrucomicrobiaceae bacterium]
MELALYDQQEGYYGAGPPRIGRGGDFFTSVSTGPLFGRLLAMLARQRWERCGRPADFMLVEQGAHDGQLAEDILAALDIPGACYGIVEPNPRYREVQRKRLGERVRWLDGLSQVPQASFLLSNELPDAFPVHVLRWVAGEWLELQVNEALEWVPCPVVEAELAAEVARLPQDVEEGHTVEVSLEALRWLRALAAVRPAGGILIADYGLDAEEIALRPAGTLRRYHAHQTDERVLENLGRCDLTAHVHFTRLIEEAQALGLRVADYDLQGRFLTRLAAPWLREQEGRRMDAATLRQFQSLTHPALMGRSFRCLLLECA